MGKNINQIATFADLYSIGYRVPSGKENSAECVTYADLKNMDLKYSSNGSMNNVCVDRSYYKGYQDLRLNTATSELDTFSGTFRTDVTRITSSGIKSKFIGTLEIPPEADVVYFPSAVIYVKLYPESGYNYSNFNFQIRLHIQDQVNIYKWSGSWVNIAGTSNVDYSQGKSLSFTIPNLTLLEPNNTYYLYLDYEYSGKSGYSSGCYAAFEMGSIYFQAYSGNKCVPWQYVKGSLGQVTSDGKIVSNAASITVQVYLTESIVNDPDFDSFKIYYYYKSANRPWKQLEIASKTNIPEYSKSYQFEIKIPIHPVNETEVVADYIGIWCGTLSSARLDWPNFTWTITRLDGTTETATVKDRIDNEWTSAYTTTAVKGGYTSVLRNLKSIKLAIT